MSRTFETPDALLAAAGTDLGASDWVVVDQDRIDAFAAATGDHQWIHTDPNRAANGPFGGTIAHGYLSLSLLAPWLVELLEVRGAALTVNAGSDRVRFIAPVPSGSRIRARGQITAAEQIPTGVRARTTMTVEIENGDKPALVAEILTVYVPG